jgi:ribosome maturation factor RimP
MLNLILHSHADSVILHSEVRKIWKGTDEFPSSFVKNMSSENQIANVKKLLESLLEEDMFLVEIRIKPTNNVKIFIDADKGLPLERCIKVNRALYKQLEEMAIFPDGDFSLEVSSPGVDEPLKLKRQYSKNIGREVEVVSTDGTIVTGKLIASDEEGFNISRMEGKGKKAVVREDRFSYDGIKQVTVQIKF